jgi:hypothetical protein
MAILNLCNFIKLFQKKTMAENKNPGNGIAFGACFGVVFGAAYGIISEDIPRGIGLGLSIGVFIGAIFDFVKNRQQLNKN